MSKEQAKQNALLITEKLNENNIDIFRKWNFKYRGGEIWTKKVNDSTVYHCYFRKDDDTISLVVSSRYMTSKEFPCLIQIDTSQYWSYQFKQSNDGRIAVFAESKEGHGVVVILHAKGISLKGDDTFQICPGIEFHTEQ